MLIGAIVCTNKSGNSTVQQIIDGHRRSFGQNGYKTNCWVCLVSGVIEQNSTQTQLATMGLKEKTATKTKWTLGPIPMICLALTKYIAIYQ